MADNSTWTPAEQMKIEQSLEKLKHTDPEKYSLIKKSYEEKLKRNITPEIKFK